VCPDRPDPDRAELQDPGTGRTARRPRQPGHPGLPGPHPRRRVPGHRARPRCPARARHQSGPRVSGDQRDSHHRTTRLQFIQQHRRASCGPAPASSGGCSDRRRTGRSTPGRPGARRGRPLPGGRLEGASRWKRALVRRTARSTATGASPVPAPAGGHRSPPRICPRRARPIPADCRPGGPASLSLRAAAYRGRAAEHHRR
jgi:hypothetical protein